MTQTDFYDKIIEVLSTQAPDHDPQIMAYSMYHLMKSHPKHIKTKGAKLVVFKESKSLLNKHLGWDMPEIHFLLITLKELSKYI